MNLNKSMGYATTPPVAAGKMLLKCAGLLVVAMLLSGCPAANPLQQATALPASNKVIIRGSNTIGEELGPKLIAEFQKDHPGVDFDVVTKATGYGYASLRSEQCDIAAASRLPTKDEQEEARSMNAQLVGSTIGFYSVAVVVNKNNPLSDLTKEMVRQIFTGKITNWKEVGGGDAPIHLYVRDPISGTYLGFKELAMDNLPYAALPTLCPSYSAIAQQVAQDDAGIGYLGISATPEGVKAVSIGGVQASALAINSGKYPFVRNLYFYTNKNHESAPAKDFVLYVLSSKGQEVLTQLGYVPHP